MDNLMGEDYAIQNLSSFHIARLFRKNEERQEGFQPISHHFRDDFVNYIAKGDRAELTRVRSSNFLGMRAR